MSQTDSYLTLCVEERDESNYDKIVHRMFLSYDVEQESYVVYGRSQRTGIDNEPYFFRALLIPREYLVTRTNEFGIGVRIEVINNET